MKDKYERKRTTKHIRKRTETDIYCVIRQHHDLRVVVLHMP